MNNKTTEHNPGASDSARLFNIYSPSLFKTPPVERVSHRDIILRARKGLIGRFG